MIGLPGETPGVPTAFDAVFSGEGRNLALKRGANVFMPNNTPVK